MKGKKTDPIFISQFIQESVQVGAETSEQIIQRAKIMIRQIDEEIKKIELKKVRRSKLLDVIFSFENPIKDKTEDAKVLDFFKLSYPEMCQSICNHIGEYNDLFIHNKNYENISYNFCIKQLIEYKILVRVNDLLMQGSKFNEYMQFILDKNK